MIYRSRMSARQCLEHPWMAQHAEAMSRIALPTEKLKKFIVRRKWQVRIAFSYKMKSNLCILTQDAILFVLTIRLQYILLHCCVRLLERFEFLSKHT